jgi:hypothetical protein
MKKLLAILVLSLSIITPFHADDIRDFQIEGVSLRDSLLDKISEKEIKDFQNLFPQKGYIYDSKEYYSLTFGKKYINVPSLKLSQYNDFQVHLKSDDKKYILAAISGISIMSYKKCLKEIDIIEKELDNLFKNTKKSKKRTQKHPWDKTGESFVTDLYYRFTDGSSAGLVCTDWTDSMIKEYPGIYDHLRLKLSTGEFVNWMRNKAYK